MRNAAILFEPDGYLLEGPRSSGRQSAGAGFLRAAVAGLKGETVWGYTRTNVPLKPFGAR